MSQPRSQRPGGEDDGQEAHVKREVEDFVLSIERLITTHNGSQLSKWCREQHRDLQRSAEIDSKALGLQEETTETCIRDIKEEVDRQTMDKNKASNAALRYRDEKEREFAEELRKVGESHTEAAAEAVREYTSKVRAVGEQWDANAWDRLDRQLGAVSWQQARMVHASNPTAGVADVYTTGALNEYLEAEKEGWARSQEHDLERLTADIQAEAGQVFTNLQARLRKMAPEAILVKPWIEKLTEMVAEEKKRLKVLEQEATSAYESEIDAAMWQCTEDYHGYDSELQRILVRCLDERCRSLTQCRELKLALCRWRLDYQRLYIKDIHQVKTEYQQRRSTNTIFATAKETAPRRFMMVRRLMRRLWSHGKVPYPERHAFLKKVCDVACRHGVGSEFSKLYRTEIEKYGALPLIDQARNPEALQLWMQALVLHKKPKKETEDVDDDKALDESHTMDFAMGLSRKNLAKRGTGFV
jgi:hypothetical protein